MTDNLTQLIDAAAEVLSRSDRIACMTGAGISAESGVATFRGAGGLWEGHRVEQVATPEAFARDPSMVWRFYQARRKSLLKVRPNAGHLALAQMARMTPEFALITQNVDGLHQAAGSGDVLCLHGDIWIDRCNGCGDQKRVAELAQTHPKCSQCGGLIRPGVVWFGEMLPVGVFERASQTCAAAQVMLVVGTSSMVQPAASLANWAKRAGAVVIEVNPEATPLSEVADIVVCAKAGEALPQIVNRWRGSRIAED